MEKCFLLMASFSYYSVVRAYVHIAKSTMNCKAYLGLGGFSKKGLATLLIIFALGKLMNKKEDQSQLSAIARQGSGSASEET
ncbi:diphosphomevalonate decarboxylase MVD1, peroxisomal-like [Rosa rugosa]|uniref:diphosphomevalonate decarboxylase MVD1, peroxisomal-like n=1 Tax=Rosa rugosa TaxID=74645 RepID=UPI002B40271E|nr:diphosphomevalonate decarboxylase MVD1, peroxisomal-like [Rosa rugosa]